MAETTIGPEVPMRRHHRELWRRLRIRHSGPLLSRPRRVCVAEMTSLSRTQLRRVGAEPCAGDFDLDEKVPPHLYPRGPVSSVPGLTAPRRTALVSLRPSFP